MFYGEVLGADMRINYWNSKKCPIFGHIINWFRYKRSKFYDLNSNFKNLYICILNISLKFRNLYLESLKIIF